jgi:hypothetical protein
MANKSKSKVGKTLRPAQTQARQPGLESKMKPHPKADDKSYAGANKLRGRVALITGGDSGIGRAVAISFAKEGADVAVVYLDEEGDAEETQGLVEKHDARCLLLRGDVGKPAFLRTRARRTARKGGSLAGRPVIAPSLRRIGRGTSQQFRIRRRHELRAPGEPERPRTQASVATGTPALPRGGPLAARLHHRGPARASPDSGAWPTSLAFPSRDAVHETARPHWIA